MYVTDQPDYINAAASLETAMGPREFLRQLKTIESDFGRVPSERYGPRLLDLDLLTYGSLNFRGAGVSIPHPRLQERLFVLAPLADLDRELLIPGQGIVGDLADHVFVEQSVERVEAYADL